MEQWTHFSVVVENECLWRVPFDNPPINLVTPKVSCAELDAVQAGIRGRLDERVVHSTPANRTVVGSLR